LEQHRCGGGGRSSSIRSTRQSGPILQTYRYDQVIDTGRGGIVKTKKERIIRTKEPSNNNNTNNQSTTSSVSDSTIANVGSLNQRQQKQQRQRRISSVDDDDSTSDDESTSSVDVEALAVVKSLKKNKAVRPKTMKTNKDNDDDDDHDGKDSEVEEKYVLEVKKQARAASVIQMKKRCASTACTTNGGADSGIVGQMGLLRNAHCHICHKRSDTGYVFACGNASHIYCAAHVNVRIQLTTLD
jgi:hypothetical protein